MPEIKNAMDVFKLLEKSNCRKCNKPTCLAFAAAVFQGQMKLEECPFLDQAVIDQYQDHEITEPTWERENRENMERLKNEISNLDLASAARRLGEDMRGDTLTLKCLGKDFSVDARGDISTDIHVHPWIVVPVFDYIVAGKGLPVTGNWVPLRELKGGQDWYRLFGQRCEKPIKKLADSHTDFFEDLIHLFNGQQVENHYDSDISLVLKPLPRVPMLICYWKPDDGMESELNLFFDDTADKNLNIEALYTLGAGLTLMFEKIALRHGTD